LRGIRRHADAYSNCNSDANIVGYTYTKNSSNSEESADTRAAPLEKGSPNETASWARFE
jgi:hypothetical protein